jgi:hypothetical protein
MFGKLFGCVTTRVAPVWYAITSRLKVAICSYFLCARVDSNHHPVYTGQGPQPYSPAPYTSVRVQIVRYIRVCGHIGRIGQIDICQRFVTRKPRYREDLASVDRQVVQDLTPVGLAPSPRPTT